MFYIYRASVIIVYECTYVAVSNVTLSLSPPLFYRCFYWRIINHSCLIFCCVSVSVYPRFLHETKRTSRLCTDKKTFVLYPTLREMNSQCRHLSLSTLGLLRHSLHRSPAHRGPDRDPLRLRPRTKALPHARHFQTGASRSTRSRMLTLTSFSSAIQRSPSLQTQKACVRPSATRLAAAASPSAPLPSMS